MGELDKPDCQILKYNIMSTLKYVVPGFYLGFFIWGAEVVRFKVEAMQLQGWVQDGDMPPPAQS